MKTIIESFFLNFIIFFVLDINLIVYICIADSDDECYKK